MKSKPKPCNIPCPKCGSIDINRQNRIAGDRFSIDIDNNFDMMPYCDGKDWPNAYQWDHVVLKECITHHCRCCKYNWATSPLKTK